MKKSKLLLIFIAAVLMISACNKPVSNVIATEETTEDTSMIYDDSDRVIPGEAVLNTDNLLDITSLVITEEGYEVKAARFYDELSMLVLEQNAATGDVMLLLYDPLEGEIIAEVTFAAEKNSEFNIYVIAQGGKIILEDFINETYYAIASESSEPVIYECSEVEYTSKILLSDGTGFYFIKSAENNDLYFYSFEHGTETNMYELSDDIKNPELIDETEDNTIVIIDYKNEDEGRQYYGFIDLYNIEVTLLEHNDFTMKICGNDFIFCKNDAGKYITLYSKTKPRELISFSLEEIEESSSLAIDTSGRYISTIVPKSSSSFILRIYDKDEAILSNQMNISVDIDEISYSDTISVSDSLQLAAITYDDGDGVKLILWNIAIAGDVIGMNSDIYFGN